MKKLMLLLASLSLAVAGCAQSPESAPASSDESVSESESASSNSSEDAASDQASDSKEDKEESSEDSNDSKTSSSDKQDSKEQNSKEEDKKDSDSQSTSSKDSSDQKSDEDKKFEQYLDDYIIEVCEEDYTTAHHYFEDPAAYGIDVSKCTVTLGDFVATDEEKKDAEDLLKQLQSFKADKLNKTNADLLEQLTWQSDMIVKSNDSKYDYLAPIFSGMQGVQSNLVTFFSEYQLFSEQDIPYLIELINDTPNYISKALDYSKRQAELGLLRIDMDTVLSDVQEVIDNKDDSPVSAELDLEIDSLMLDDKKAEDYKKQIHEALDKSFFPSFESLIKGLNDLKSKNKESAGLGCFVNGDDYYELLLEYYSGKQIDADTIIEDLEEKMDNLLDEYQELVSKNPKAGNENPKTDFKKIDEILPFLEENYSKDFPVLEPMDYELQALSPEQSNEGVLAYFVIPPIDSKRAYEIRYNNVDYGDDPQSFQLFDTLAHEGIPGHMYQQQYNREHYVHTAQYFQDSYGFSEGYAVYAASEASTWLKDLNEDDLLAYRLNEEYTNYMALIMDVEINYLGYTMDDFIEQYGEGLESMYIQLADNPGVFFAYYYGSALIEDLQEEAKEELKDKFDPVDFNNALLSSGTVKYSIMEKNIEDYIKDNQ